MSKVIESLPFVFMRGGTSKGIFLSAASVPGDRERLTPMLLDIMGSPDRRQIDGLGGSDKLTSKAAIIGRPVRQGSDVTFLFGQVGVWAAEVDYGLNCGNLTSAVGMYAIQEGLVKPVEGNTLVRVHNLNTDKIIRVEVPVKDGVPLVKGDFEIAGVPGTGAAISIDFSAAAGAKTGSLLPLGEPTSRLKVPELGAVEISLVDMANLVVFVAAASLGMEGTEGPDEIDGDRELLSRMNAIRREVAYAVGLKDYWDRSEVKSVPTLVVVQHPSSYKHYGTGDIIKAEDMHVLARLYGSGSTSRAFAGGSTACTGVACRIAGSIPNRFLSPQGASARQIRIGHPTGVIVSEAMVSMNNGAYEVRTAKIFRTARRLAEGRLYLKNGVAVSDPHTELTVA